MTALALIDADPCWADVPTGNAPPDPVEALIAKLGPHYAVVAAALAPLVRMSMPPTPQALRLEMRTASDMLESLLSDPIEAAARDSYGEDYRVTEQDRLNVGGEVMEPFWDALRAELGVVHTCRVCSAEYTAEARAQIQTRLDAYAGVASGECACGNTLAWEG